MSTSNYTILTYSQVRVLDGEAISTVEPSALFTTSISAIQHSALLLPLRLLLRTALITAAERTGGLCFPCAGLQVVLRDPFLFVTGCADSLDFDRCGGGRHGALFLLGREVRCIREVANSAKDASDDQVGENATVKSMSERQLIVRIPEHLQCEIEDGCWGFYNRHNRVESLDRIRLPLQIRISTNEGAVETITLTPAVYSTHRLKRRSWG